MKSIRQFIVLLILLLTALAVASAQQSPIPANAIILIDSDDPARDAAHLTQQAGVRDTLNNYGADIGLYRAVSISEATQLAGMIPGRVFVVGEGIFNTQNYFGGAVYSGSSIVPVGMITSIPRTEASYYCGAPEFFGYRINAGDIQYSIAGRMGIPLPRSANLQQQEFFRTALKTYPGFGAGLSQFGFWGTNAAYRFYTYEEVQQGAYPEGGNGTSY